MPVLGLESVIDVTHAKKGRIQAIRTMKSPELSWARFSGLDPSEPTIEDLAAASVAVSLKPNEVLIEEDEDTGHVYLIESGVVRTVRYSRDGHEIWLADIAAGALVGEIAALTNSLRTSSVVASTPVSAFRVSQLMFQRSMESSGRFATVVATLMAQRTTNTSSKLASVIGMSVASRLHAELVRMAAPKSNETEIFDIPSPPTVSELASRIHATREATSRALSTLERSGLAKRQPNSLRVVVPFG